MRRHDKIKGLKMNEQIIPGNRMVFPVPKIEPAANASQLPPDGNVAAKEKEMQITEITEITDKEPVPDNIIATYWG